MREDKSYIVLPFTNYTLNYSPFIFNQLPVLMMELYYESGLCIPHILVIHIQLI